ncbi:hypothetical protein DVS28_a5105 [Euzebya pacifica]|uniref:Uncharacterized protein n=1 Tax=Euzebya pacifica TaxID=1608957 RepID=A0A346Y5L4_9ACTN|nr:hypothetical protein DVS28_a5105 [Euzebya pacifica]
MGRSIHPDLRILGVVTAGPSMLRRSVVGLLLGLAVGLLAVWSSGGRAR